MRCRKGPPTSPVNWWLLSAQESWGPVTWGQASLTPRLHPCPRREGEVQLLHGSLDGKVGYRERPSGREAPGGHLGQGHKCQREHGTERKPSGRPDHLFDLISEPELCRLCPWMSQVSQSPGAAGSRHEEHPAVSEPPPRLGRKHPRSWVHYLLPTLCDDVRKPSSHRIVSNGCSTSVSDIVSLVMLAKLAK